MVLSKFRHICETVGNARAEPKLVIDGFEISVFWSRSQSCSCGLESYLVVQKDFELDCSDFMDAESAQKKLAGFTADVNRMLRKARVGSTDEDDIIPSLMPRGIGRS